LLGVNQNFKPVDIRNELFLFHKNGPAELPTMDGNSKDVFDLGEFPVHSLIENLCSPCYGLECKTFKVGAKILGTCGSFPETRIYGNDKNGNPIYSYVKSKDGKDEICQCSQEESQYYNDPIEGVSIKLTNILTAYDIEFSTISGIIKEVTPSPVEYYAINGNTATPIARIESFEATSSYRIYKVPSNCIKQNCVFGLFKIKKPERYYDESQAFITDNLKAVLSIAIGVDKKHKRDELEMGQRYIGDGILSLANEVREENSNNEYPIQVSKSVAPRKRKFF
jgi:hypothetical protein